MNEPTGRSFRAAILAVAMLFATAMLIGVGAARGSVAAADAVVGDARLGAAASDARNWIVPGGSYANLHYSKLAQIDRTTVASLAPRGRFTRGCTADSKRRRS
jgi:glucose dehydrogenase